MAGFLNEFPLPPPLVAGKPFEIFDGPGGNLWFEDKATNQVGRITPAGAITEFPKPAGAPGFVGGFTTGPDGNLWFPEATFRGTGSGRFTLYDTYDGTIGRVTPSGDVAEFPLPSSKGASPSRLTVGPDGNLWFTMEPNGGSQTTKYAIGRITPAGVITEFPLTDSIDHLKGITVGSDGNLWFGGRTSLGRITPEGAITRFPLPGLVQLADDLVLAPDGNIWFTGALSNNVGRITPSGTITVFPIVAVTLLVGPDNNLWWGTTRITLDGEATDFSPPSIDVQILSQANGPDGNLWFVEVDDNIGKVGRITRDGVITRFPLGPDADKFGTTITAGPDGNLWISEGSGGKVARITTEGVLTEFPLGRFLAPAVPSVAPAIAAGPDGALWFTKGPSQVGRITTAGVITEYALPPGSEGPRVIAAGPDGNLWYTRQSGQIGRITTAGTITEFSVPNAGSSIATGPDGNLWFTQTTNKIGRITTAGTVTDFTAPTSFFQTIAITAGADGNLWFTESVGNVGMITPAGVITEFAAPGAPNSQLGGIAAGPDGNVWFLYQNEAKIGRITPAGTITVFATPAIPSDGITAGPDGNLWFTEPGKVMQAVLAELLVPVPLSIGLDPAGDSGTSGSDLITSVNRPTFVGDTTPGSTVRVFARRSDQAAAALLGQAIADPSGRWSLAAETLADGSYIITAGASDALGRTGAAGLPASSPLIIATQGPKVAGLSLAPRTGALMISFLGGPAGLAPGSLIDLTRYVLTRPVGRRMVRLAIARVATASPSGPGGTETVSLMLRGGRRLRPGTYMLTIAPGGIADRAGNLLDGSFAGTFPSGGSARPGVAFAARLKVSGHRALRILPARASILRRSP